MHFSPPVETLFFSLIIVPRSPGKRRSKKIGGRRWNDSEN